MITGAIKSQGDRHWDQFWSGGISNPLLVIEQITYLPFARRLDELKTLKESQANVLGTPVENPLFNKKQQKLRWSRFKDLEAGEMFLLFRDEVFPFLKELNGLTGAAFREFMKDAVLIIPTPQLLERAVTMINDIPMQDRDTKGDLYDYLLSKIAQAGVNGQFHTPRHIIRLMVDLVALQPNDIICDPASGTCGFLVAVWEYLREHHKSLFHNKKQLANFQHTIFKWIGCLC